MVTVAMGQFKPVAIVKWGHVATVPVRSSVIVVGILNIILVNVREAIMNFCFFFNAIGQKVLSEEALESLEKDTMKFYAFWRCIFHLPFSTSTSFNNSFY
jgi:hypothetical protein